MRLSGKLKTCHCFRRWGIRHQWKSRDLYSQLRGKGPKMPSWFKVKYNWHVTQTFNSRVVTAISLSRKTEQGHVEDIRATIYDNTWSVIIL